MTHNTDLPIPHVEQLFATPLIVETVADRDVNREAIVAALTTAAGGKRPGEAWNGTAGGWAATLQKLIGHVSASAGRRTTDVRQPQRPPQWRMRSVAHVVGQGEHLDIASAYDAFWSAIYVAEDGYRGMRDAEHGGELVFHDPRLPGPMMEMPDLRLRTDMTRPGAVYTPEVAVRPATGYLLLYPGWLRVSMRPIRIPGPRMIIGLSLVAPFDGHGQ